MAALLSLGTSITEGSPMTSRGSPPAFSGRDVISSSASLLIAGCHWCVRAGLDRAARHDVTTLLCGTAVTFRRAVRSSLRAVSGWNSTSMVQNANHASLVTSLPIVEQVLGNHVSELGHDFIAYRHHV